MARGGGPTPFFFYSRGGDIITRNFWGERLLLYGSVTLRLEHAPREPTRAASSRDIGLASVHIRQTLTEVNAPLLPDARAREREVLPAPVVGVGAGVVDRQDGERRPEDPAGVSADSGPCWTTVRRQEDEDGWITVPPLTDDVHVASLRPLFTGAPSRDEGGERPQDGTPRAPWARVDDGAVGLDEARPVLRGDKTPVAEASGKARRPVRVGRAACRP